jgi:hypothetical protein
MLFEITAHLLVVTAVSVSGSVFVGSWTQLTVATNKPTSIPTSKDPAEGSFLPMDNILGYETVRCVAEEEWAEGLEFGNVSLRSRPPKDTARGRVRYRSGSP